MTHSFEVFIDESGDEGFVFRPYPEQGSSEWFVLSAVIVPQPHAPEIISITQQARRHLGKPPSHALHFRELNHDQKVAWTEFIANAPLAATSIFIQKTALTDVDTFRERFRLYYYTTRFLLERVSWFCRDQTHLAPQGDGTARLIFSKRKNLAYNELKSYLRWLRMQSRSDLSDIRIHWPAINLHKLEAETHHRFAGLQMVDGVASGLRASLEYSRCRNTEHRYAKMLEPIIYRHRGRSRSYGLKFFPEVPRLSTDRSRTHWLRKHYGR